ncbi:GTP cyclohydrolase II [Enterococcus raffinosus]|uniref:GTP cyclohydrolase II n=1 Tax=Enterococcus raffinosus TaxID=71452 RepID=UPI0028927CCB|nr:GTP cyclohydrolase II [Enterococcus raffinosus]MDT2522440.1 GTP cyclohydrolase II [Enterococcus raffinosus]MDT2533643.1 GTP cyclohydrolase II [Enterococcus raffinosus]MDT2591180.1 GTP cyclohydrolase II [Enterococcus raffinosus]
MSEERIQAAIKQLREGGLVIVADDDNREAEGDLIGVANLATSETVNFMTKFARGLICAPISQKIATRLALSEMVEQNTDSFGTAFTVSVDHRNTTTGISAFERAETIQELANPKSQAVDFHRPGHIFPLIGKDGGVLERRGHTEAALDLAQLANQSEAAYICEILNEDGTMARRPQLEELAETWQLPFITIEELATYLSAKGELTVELPTAYGDFQLSLFEDQEQRENLLLSKGNIQESEQPLLVRIHSECLTGDVFGSHRCDCGEQLHESMRMIEKEGTGVILYLRQEGRGIGLKNKLRAYQLQENGRDTVEANLELGFHADERKYDFAAEMLQAIHVNKVRLMTNNPDKIQELENMGIEVVERVPLEITPVKENENYLKTKKEKFHHLLHV